MRRRRALGSLAVAAVLGALLFLPQQSTAYELRWDVRTLRDGIQPIYDPSLTTPDNSRTRWCPWRSTATPARIPSSRW